ncbi:MAG: WD40 repeat domain-containing protein [Bacteroides sp.]|nr:WD40 repeat domain-containing protein [Bacteroides sp.]
MNQKRFFKGVAFCLLAALGCNEVAAQVEEKRSFPSKEKITAFDNTTFCTAFLVDGTLLTLRDIPVVNLGDIDQIVFNPTGSSLALMRGKKEIGIWSFRNQDKKLFELKDKRKDLKKRQNLPFTLTGEAGAELMKAASKGDIVSLAMCYAADARTFVASNSLGEVIIYDTKEYLPQAYIQGKAPATALTMSPNNYFIAAGTGKNVDIWNFQTKELRKAIPTTGMVTGMDFSDDSALLAVVTDDNRLTIYDTKTWEPVDAFDKIGGKLANPSFHPEGKYVSVVKDGNAIVIVNLKNSAIEQTLDEAGQVVSGSKFFMDKQTSDVFMLSNRTQSLVFWDANGLNPFFGKIMNKEVDAKMSEWVKMMEGETLEDYAIRVNDESRLKQQQLFAQEVATELAGDRISIDNPFVGDYDATNSMLNIGFNAMPSIALEVPEGEVGDFKDNKNLKFENAVYVLNDKDEFELAYVEVRNEVTNKVYIFDNIGRLEVQAMEADENFVPLEVMQQASREEIQLKEIKEQVIEEKKQDKLITDNTQIDVKTEVVPGVDANGNKIYNYKVGYQYEVINKAFSAKEDFPSGGYNIERSNAAMSLMKIIKNAFEGDFAKYLAEGKQVKIIITGSADASPIRGRIAYNGQYGEYTDEPYYKNGNLDNITVTKASGITSNEQLALMRAAGVKDYIEKNVTTLENTQNNYEYHVEVAKERGGEFRKINVEFLIMDAFPVK